MSSQKQTSAENGSTVYILYTELQHKPKTHNTKFLSIHLFSMDQSYFTATPNGRGSFQPSAVIDLMPADTHMCRDIPIQTYTQTHIHSDATEQEL